MFGTFRYLLAHLVVFVHLWVHSYLWFGVYAVFSFYALSGYLMALILDQSYPATRDGVRRYFANRALRIYPAYCVVLALAAALVWVDPATAWRIGQIQMPANAIEWLRNLFIFTLHADHPASARLVSLAWSLDIELCFYVAMGLGLGRSRRTANLWFVLSVIVSTYLLWSEAPFPTRYQQLVGASLPYSMGALVYHHRERLGPWLASRWHGPVAIVAYMAHCLLAAKLWGFRQAFSTGFYVSLLPTAYVIAALASVDRRRVPRWLARVDTELGNLAYPVFLAHLPVAALVVMTTGITERGTTLVVWGSLAANVVGWMVHMLTDWQGDRLRDRVRGGPALRLLAAAKAPA